MELVELLKNFDEFLNEFLLNAGALAPILSSVLIVFEGTLAFLPLFVFVTINVLTLGPIIGGLVSWICTVFGSFIAFNLFRVGFSKQIDKKAKKSKSLRQFMRRINKIKFSQLVFIISIPFSPSFFINVAAGLSKINRIKYFYSLLVGKIGVIIFCGFIGVNLIECFTNPYAIIKIILVVGVVYWLSRIINKRFNLDERF